MLDAGPRLLVFSSLFPSSARPQAGLFIRERLRHVMPPVYAVVVSPQPWFPLQQLLRRLRPGYRPAIPRHEVQGGLEVFSPRFLSLPGLGRRFDGFMMAVCSFAVVRREVRRRRLELIDAHFAYPDGYAASLLSRWLKVPFIVTLRGTEHRACRTPALRRRLLWGLDRATRVVTVANSLRDVVATAGADSGKIERVGNGVDTERFHPVDRVKARVSLGIPDGAPVLVSVGGLVPRKGFHRVIDLLPPLRERWPGLRYLVVGGASPEGNYLADLQQQVDRLQLWECVHFLGAMPPEALKVPLSAADIFVLATENEGWANVFLEAMACGLPVVTTRVGGNPEVVENDTLGCVVPFGDGAAMQACIEKLLINPPDRSVIRRHAEGHSWNARVTRLLAIYGEAAGVRQ